MTNDRVWRRVPLGDVSEKIDYGHTASAVNSEVGPKFLRISDLQKGDVNWEAVPYCIATEREGSKYALRPGDIVFARTGATTGKSFLIRNPPRSVFASYLIRVRLSELVEPRFLARFFESEEYWAQIKKNSRGAGQPGVNATKLKNLEIPLPSLTEQKRIADILDKADEIRDKRGRSCKDVQQLKESTFVAMFGDPRVTGASWKTVRMKDVSLLDAPMVDPREDHFANMVHIGPDRIEKKTGRMLPALTAREENLISKKFLFDERYLLYSKIRPYLRKVALPAFSGLCSADMYPVRPVEGKTTREYLYSLLISDAFLAYTETLSSRANIPKLNRKELASYEFPLPPYELQLKYSKFMKAQAKLAKKYDDAYQESEDLFNSLVQRAFKGEL